jgi:hypothetical protein
LNGHAVAVEAHKKKFQHRESNDSREDPARYLALSVVLLTQHRAMRSRSLTEILSHP